MVEDAGKTVERAWLEYVKAVRNGDAAGMAAVFSEDAFLLAPNVAMIRGRKAIQKFTEFQIKVGMKDAVFTTVQTSRNADTIYEVGNLDARISPEGQRSFEEKLQYVCIWKQTPSGLKLHTAIWNSREPPQEPPRE
jgi:uncharacterized protein (TIGR02246 family)